MELLVDTVALCRIRIFANLVAFIAACLGTSVHASPGTNTHILRVGFSKSLFAEVNENDATAAVKMWSQTLVKERNIKMDTQPATYPDVDAIRQDLRQGLINSVAMTVAEYDALRQEIPFNRFIASVNGSTFTETYVLLTHQDSKILNLKELRGRKLNFHDHPRASLAPIWLETLLLQEGMGRIDKVIGEVTYVNKLTKAVLPVYFRQVDACVAPQMGFKTMCELNPQVGRQLKVLAISPPYTPTGYFLQLDPSSEYSTQIITEIEKVNETLTGRQVLTIFQCDQLKEYPLSCLDTALELLSTHKRLRGGVNISTLKTTNAILNSTIEISK